MYYIAAVFSVLGKFWRAFHRKLAVFVQGKLCSISKLLCRAVYDLSFVSKIALLCLSLFVLCYFIQVLLSEVFSALQELLITRARQHVETRLVFSADWTEAKTLSQAHIHGFEIRCVLQVCHEYSLVSHKLLLAWTVAVGYNSNLKSYCTLKNTRIE